MADKFFPMLNEFLRDLPDISIPMVLVGVDYLHVSFDVDSLCPSEAPGTGTRVPCGRHIEKPA